MPRSRVCGGVARHSRIDRASSPRTQIASVQPLPSFVPLTLRWFVCLFIHSFVRSSFIRSFVRSFVRLFRHSSTPSFVSLPIRSFVRLFLPSIPFLPFFLSFLPVPWREALLLESWTRPEGGPDEGDRRAEEADGGRGGAAPYSAHELLAYMRNWCARACARACVRACVRPMSMPCESASSPSTPRGASSPPRRL